MKLTSAWQGLPPHSLLPAPAKPCSSLRLHSPASLWMLLLQAVSSLLSQVHTQLRHQASLLSHLHCQLRRQASLLNHLCSQLRHQASVLSPLHCQLRHQASLLSQHCSQLRHQASLLSQHCSQLRHQSSLLRHLLCRSSKFSRSANKMASQYCGVLQHAHYCMCKIIHGRIQYICCASCWLPWPRCSAMFGTTMTPLGYFVDVHFQALAYLELNIIHYMCRNISWRRISVDDDRVDAVISHLEDMNSTLKSLRTEGGELEPYIGSVEVLPLSASIACPCSPPAQATETDVQSTLTIWTMTVAGFCQFGHSIPGAKANPFNSSCAWPPWFSCHTLESPSGSFKPTVRHSVPLSTYCFTHPVPASD